MMEPAVDLIQCKIAHTACAITCLSAQIKSTQEYLTEIRKLCDLNGTVLIFDETRTGFRWHINGAQKLFDVNPDLATFGKSMANGFSVSALVGKRELMELGSTDKKNKERTFLLSSTHGAEISSLEAFRATVKKLDQENVCDYLWTYGAELKSKISEILESSLLKEYISIDGPPISPEFKFRESEHWSVDQLRTKFFEELLNFRIMMPTITPSFSHGSKEIRLTSNAIYNTLSKINFNMKRKSYFSNQKHLLLPVFRKVN